MIFKKTKLDVSDNSGALIVKCIGFWKPPKTKFISINEIVRVSLIKFNRSKFYAPKNLKGKSNKKIISELTTNKKEEEKNNISGSHSLQTKQNLNKKKKKGFVKKSATKKARIKQRQDMLLFLGIILSCAKNWKRKDGTFVKTKKNRVTLLNTQLKFLGTRIIGPVLKETRSKKKLPLYKEIISFAKRRL